MVAALEPIGVTMKMGTIFDLMCRSVLVGEAGHIVWLGKDAAVGVCACHCERKEGCRRALMRPPPTVPQLPLNARPFAQLTP